MPYIKNITFENVGRKEGLYCDRCGAYITNIYTVYYSDGLVAKYGVECFQRLFVAGNLSDYGAKLMKKAINKIAEAYKERNKWLKVNTIEEAKTAGLDVFTFENYDSWKGSTFEEYKEFCISEDRGFFANKIKSAKEILKKFENVNFNLDKLMEESNDSKRLV